MKRNLVLFAAMLAMSMSGCCYKWIDSGYVGVRVTGSGSNRGIDPKPIGVGRAWYNPFYDAVYEFPVYEQNVLWSNASRNGDESITLSTAQGQTINVDVGLTFDIDENKVPEMFNLLRKDIDQITHQWLRNHVRDALNAQTRQTETMEILGAGGTKILDNAKSSLNEDVASYGITIKMLAFANAPRPDKAIQDSINQTLMAKQLATQAENKVAQSRAEADQKIEDARGRAESMIVEAEAKFKTAELEARGNEAISKSLTPALIQYQTTLKWNGELPKYTGGPVPLLTLGKE